MAGVRRQPNGTASKVLALDFRLIGSLHLNPALREMNSLILGSGSHNELATFRVRFGGKANGTVYGILPIVGEAAAERMRI